MAIIPHTGNWEMLCKCHGIAPEYVKDPWTEHHQMKSQSSVLTSTSLKHNFPTIWTLAPHPNAGSSLTNATGLMARWLQWHQWGYDVYRVDKAKFPGKEWDSVPWQLRLCSSHPTSVLPFPTVCPAGTRQESELSLLRWSTPVPNWPEKPAWAPCVFILQMGPCGYWNPPTQEA